MQKRKSLQLLTLLSASLLTGCAASLSDLQNMSAEDRTDYVCERRPEVEALYGKINRSVDAVRRIEKALRLGYWERRKCTTYRYRDKKGYLQSVTHCLPVKGPPVDTLGAEAALSGEKEQLAGYKVVHQKALANCKARVMSMTPEQAFDYYKEHKQELDLR